MAATTLLACVLMTASGPAMAQQPPPAAPATGLTPLSAGDRQFVMNAVRGSEREVELGDLAKEKAQRPAIKEFAARMVADHGNAVRALKALAASKGLRVGDTKAGNEQPSMERLTKLSSAQFDKEYVETMVKDHEKDVAEFRRMSQELQDPDLRTWVARTLPTLEEHLKAVKALQSNVVGSIR